MDEAGEVAADMRPMSPGEAEACVIRIEQGTRGLRRELLELKRREGWKALGDDSFTACLRKRFPYSADHLLEIARVAEVEERLERDASRSPGIPLQQLRPLIPLTPADQQAAWQIANATAPSTGMSGQHVAAVAREFPRAKEQAGALAQAVAEQLASSEGYLLRVRKVRYHGLAAAQARMNEEWRHLRDLADPGELAQALSVREVDILSTFIEQTEQALVWLRAVVDAAQFDGIRRVK
jgi:hypothetical protein